MRSRSSFAHGDRVTLRVGDVFLKIDADQTRTDVEVEAMTMAPVATPRILWRDLPVLALAAVQETALGHLGEPSTVSSAAWAAAGAAVRALHDAPLPPWAGRDLDGLASHLARECEWLVENDVLPADVVTSNRRLAQTALRPWTPVFIHGDLQVDHVFVAGDEVTGVIDWPRIPRRRPGHGVQAHPGRRAAVAGGQRATTGRPRPAGATFRHGKLVERSGLDNISRTYCFGL